MKGTAEFHDRAQRYYGVYFGPESEWAKRHQEILDTEEQGDHAPNAMDNFCFDITLGYRRLERPRRSR